MRIELHQHDQRRRDEQLVGQRIEQHPNPGNEPVLSRQITVQPVGDRSQSKYRGRKQLFSPWTLLMRLVDRIRNQQRNTENTRDREVIRQVHTARLGSTMRRESPRLRARRLP